MITQKEIDFAINTIIDCKEIIKKSEALLKEAAEQNHTGEAKSGTLQGNTMEIGYTVTTSVEHGVFEDDLGKPMTKKATVAYLYEKGLAYATVKKNIDQLFDVTIKIKKAMVTALDNDKLPQSFADLLNAIELGDKKSFGLKQQTIGEIKDIQSEEKRESA